MKKSQVKKAKSKNEEKKEVKSNPIPDEKVFDFGGLPERDLKKNLGCG